MLTFDVSDCEYDPCGRDISAGFSCRASLAYCALKRFVFALLAAADGCCARRLLPPLTRATKIQTKTG